MSAELDRDEAARALVEIDQRQEQVIKLAIIPWWYWWAVAVLTIGLTAAVESKRPLAIGIGVTVFVLGILITTGWVVARMVGNAQLRNDLLGPTAALAILSFVAATIAVTLPTAFLLEAAEARYPATMATILGGFVMVAGGPVLMRFLRKTMLANRAGGQR
jgi:uncharacterized membrane protein